MTSERSFDPSPLDPPDAQDARVEEIVAAYVERLNRGEEIRPDEVLSEHPDLAREILDHLECFLDLTSQAKPDDNQPLGTLGDYTLRRQIGRGGMGVVYEAWQGSMDRVVALKVLPPGVAADDRAFQRFMQEAKTAGKLDHQNIVSVHAAGFDENTPYFAMEYVEGETLAQILTRLKADEPETQTVFGKKDHVRYFHNISEAFADVADGLRHAHSKGVVHRDIKPSNLIFDQENSLRILDFGLARHEGQESLTLPGELLGTPLYMSPEQARRRKIPVDHRTDIYSLGATLYEVLCGRPPFHGKDHAGTLSQIIDMDPEPPRRTNARIPNDLETITLRCLRKDPQARYTTAEALEQDFRRFVRGDPIEARPQGKWERLATQLRRRRRTYTRVALFLVVLATLVALLYLRGREEHEKNLVAYGPAVQQALGKLYRGRFSLRSAGPKERQFSFARFGCCDEASSPVTAKEYAEVWNARSSFVTDAIGELVALTRMLPEERDAHYHLARAYGLIGRIEEARDATSRTLAIDPDFLPAKVLEWELSEGEEAVKDASFEELWKAYETRNDWNKFWLLAYRSERVNNWPSAIETLDVLLEITSRGADPYIGYSVEARMARGMALLELGQNYEASLDFAIAADRARFSLEPTLFRVMATHRHGQVKEAASVVNNLFESIEPEGRDETALLVAALYQSMGEHEEALSWVRKIREVGIRDRLRAYIHYVSGEISESISVARESVARNPRDPIAHILLALALSIDVLSAGSTNTSLELLRVAKKAEELDGTSSFARDLGDMAEAIHKQFTERILNMRSATKCAVFTIALGLPGVAQSVEGYFKDVQRPPGFTGSSRLFGSGSVTADGRELYSDDWGNDHDIWVAELQEDGTWGPSTQIPQLNTVDMDVTPRVSGDGLVMVFARRPRARQRSDDADLFMTTRSDRDAPWGDVRPLDEINDPVEFEWAGSLSPDALSLYFFSSRNADDFGVPNQGGIFDVYVATRTSRDEPFGEVRSIEEVSSPSNDYGPSISGDGLTLFLSDPPPNNRPGTSGGADIWMSVRPSLDEPFGAPLNIGLPVNSPSGESEPFVSPNWPAHGSKLYFYRTSDGVSTYLHEATWVANPPKPDFSALLEGGEDSFVVLVDASTSVAGGEGHSLVSYHWDFGDGSTGQGVQASHSYAYGGRFSIVLTVTDDRDVEESLERSIVVNCPQGDTFPWVADDVGSPAIRGGSQLEGEGAESCLSLCAGGKMLGGREDAFHFVCRESFGTSEMVTARIASMEGASSAAQIGIMLRESLEPSARCAAMTLRRTRSLSLRFHFRDSEGISMSSRSGGSDLFLPQAWVRLVRNGDEFVGFASADGIEWEEVARESISEFSANYYVGVFAVGAEPTGDMPVEALRARVCNFQVGSSSTFRRGDCNDDGTIDISDAVCTLGWLFLGDEKPGCIAATNTNGDASADISDATYLLNHLFLGGHPPVAPYPDCGPGTLAADEELGCEAPPKNCPQ